MRFQSGFVRRAPFDERGPAPPRRYRGELNLLAEELWLRRSRGRRNSERRADMPRAGLSRRAARERDSNAIALKALVDLASKARGWMTFRLVTLLRAS